MVYRPLARKGQKPEMTRFNTDNQASRFKIHSTCGAGTKRHLRSGPVMTLR
jgi:hypothetical protein